MADVAPSNTADMLQYLHELLARHFNELREARARLEPSSPVFALEHDLPPHDLGLLQGAVREAIKGSHITRFHKAWLPFVVYAAEMGYGYEGDEYWTTFSSLTPRWTVKSARPFVAGSLGSAISSAERVRRAPGPTTSRSSRGRSRTRYFRRTCSGT